MKNQLPALNNLFNSINIDLNKVVNKQFINFWKHYDQAVKILSEDDFAIFGNKIKSYIPKDLKQKSWLQLYDFFDEAYIYSLLYDETGIKPSFIKEDKQTKPDMKLQFDKKLSIIEVKHISYSDNEMKLIDTYSKRVLNKQKQQSEYVDLNVHATFFKKIDVNIAKAVSQINSFPTSFNNGIIFLILRLDHDAFGDLVFGKPSSIVSDLYDRRMKLVKQTDEKSVQKQINLRVIYDRFRFRFSEERFVNLL